MADTCGEIQGCVNLWDFTHHNKVRTETSGAPPPLTLRKLLYINNKHFILKVASLETRGKFIMSIAFSPDGKMIAAASQVRSALLLTQLLHILP